MKTGRNDLCPCGSGRKYKHCCMNKEIHFDEDDILRMIGYGSDVYEKAELDNCSKFFIETTADEKFEVRRIQQEYIVKDMVPPEKSMPTNVYRTIELNDIQHQKLIKHNPQGECLSIGNHNYFDGIVEGGHFSWQMPDGFLCSKGKISKLFIRQVLGNHILNINLFPQKQENKTVDDFLETGFSIYTQTNKLDFISKDGKLFFEENQVFAILSLYDKDSLSMDEIFSQAPNEYNVSFDISIGKPIFILKVQGKGLKLSIINEKVVDVTGLQSEQE